jgi:hypothetical protein
MGVCGGGGRPPPHPPPAPRIIEMILLIRPVKTKGEIYAQNDTG